MRVGIIGCGVVGGALVHWFATKTDHRLRLRDPAKNLADDLDGVKAVFVAVPVPTTETEQDYSTLESVIGWVRNWTGLADVPIFVRSTVLPGTSNRLKVWAMPEFLTERTAHEDIEKQPIITGCPDSALLSELFPGKEIIFLTNTAAELVKYAHNCFGALKVHYFNQIYTLCETLGVSYGGVLEGILASGYINETHTRVPGPDGSLGYGGSCFPKDMDAFSRFALDRHVHELHELLTPAIINNRRS